MKVKAKGPKGAHSLVQTFSYPVFSLLRFFSKNSGARVEKNLEKKTLVMWR